MSSPMLTSFHPQGSSLALSAGDGRIKIWDATTGKLCSEMADAGDSGHLAMDYTCMAWGGLPATASAKKKKRGAKEQGGAAVVVVGTGSGDIVAWDSALGELKWRASDCHAGSVKSVSFSKSGERLYSVGIDGHICEMDCTSGQVLSKFRAAKTPLSCVAVAPDGGSVAAASAEVKLFDLSSKKRLRKFPGHPAPAKVLRFTPDGKYLLSSATGECHIVMWQVEGGTAPVTMSVEQPVVAIGVDGFDDVHNVRRVVAVTEAGVAYVWSASTVEELGSAKPTIIRIESTGKGNKPGVLAARFLENEAVVLVAHGTSVKPHFEKVSLIDQEGLSIVLNASTEGALLPAGAANTNNTVSDLRGVTVLGPDNAGEAVIPRPQIDVVPGKKKTKKRRAVDEDGEAAGKPFEEGNAVENVRPSAEETDTALTIVPDDEPTLEERLVALGLIEGDTKKDQNLAPQDILDIPRFDSLSVLLSQALKAEDNALLEKCLGASDEKAITSTIQQLRPVEAAKLLSVMVSKLEARPQRALNLVPWVRAVLLQHATFVMTNLNLQPVLTTLYEIIDTRLAVFRPLVSLSGRLDLIVAQIQKNGGHTGENENENEAAVYYEEEDDEPEAIDVIGDSASQYIEGEDDEDEESGEEEEDEDDMGDEVEMDEDEPDIMLDGNGNAMSDGEDED